MSKATFLKIPNKRTSYVAQYLIFEKNKYPKIELEFIASLLKYSNENSLNDFYLQMRSMYDSQINFTYYPLAKYDSIKISISCIDNPHFAKNLMQQLLKIVELKIATLNVKPKFFELSQTEILYKLASIYNNKMQYSISRAREELYKNDQNYLKIEQQMEVIRSLTKEQIAEIWANILENSNTQIYQAGQLNLTADLPKTTNTKQVKPIEQTYKMTKFSEVESKANNQAKLVLMYKIKNYNKDKVAAYYLFNAILGQSSTSYLFEYIREKQSLCYFITSSIDLKLKTLIIMSGIDHKNVASAKKEVKKVFKLINTDNLEIRLNHEKISLIHEIEKIKQSPGELTNFMLNKSLSDKNETLQDKINNIKKVTTQDIIEINNLIQYYGNYELQ